MLVPTFEYIARGSLLGWWDEPPPTPPSSALRLHPRRPIERTAARHTGLGARSSQRLRTCPAPVGSQRVFNALVTKTDAVNRQR